ncbi:MAG: hypothetical protein JNK60_16835 [Acidobacteria bacterium]|nr:hypothetical protein [Acidobacteriota bacterium]
MRLRKRVVLALGLSMTLPCGALLAQPAGFVIDAGVSQSRPSGTFGLNLGDSSTPLRLGYSDLNAVTTVFQPRLRYIADRFRIEVTFDQSSFHGNFSGASLPAGRQALIPASSSVFLSTSYQNFSTSFRYDLFKSATLSMGPGADLDFISLRSHALLSPSPGPPSTVGITESARTLPVPTLNFNVHDRRQRFFLDAKIGYSLDGDMAKGRAELGYLFSEHSGVKLGWEGVQYKAGSGPSGTTIRISSFTGGLFFRF